MKEREDVLSMMRTVGCEAKNPFGKSYGCVNVQGGPARIPGQPKE
jgi:hypothetical protein